jgi:hypothetical protein
MLQKCRYSYRSNWRSLGQCHIAKQCAEGVLFESLVNAFEALISQQICVSWKADSERLMILDLGECQANGVTSVPRRENPKVDITMFNPRQTDCPCYLGRGSARFWVVF